MDKDINLTLNEDLEAIMFTLLTSQSELTLENAQRVLAIGLRNRPEAWVIMPDELPAAWEKYTTEKRITV